MTDTQDRTDDRNDENTTQDRTDERNDESTPQAKPKRGSWREKKMIPGKNGQLYGPYWYERWREGGKCRSRYIGKVGYAK